MNSKRLNFIKSLQKEFSESKHYGVMDYSKICLVPGCVAEIGMDTVIEPYAVIGATGQGFEYDEDGVRWVMPQTGLVEIGKGCFIGANVVICRGTLDNTIIKDGVRIAHGSQIGHNCIIGEETFIANGVTIAGSVQIGRKCFIGSGVTIRHKIKLGDNIIVGCGSVVINNFLWNNATIAGVPAKELRR